MSYTNIALFGLGLLGILLHNLVQLNKINKANPGKFSLLNYFKLEVFSIIIAIVMVFTAIIIKVEISQLEQAGKWLGLSFIAIGYMGQSLLIFVMGKANKVIEKEDTTNQNI